MTENYQLLKLQSRL